MNPRDYLVALKRRWIDVALAVAVALGAAWLITTTVAPPGPVQREYRATAVLVSTGGFYTPGITNIQALASLTTVGEVPERAARTLGSDEPPYQLAQRIQAVADIETGFLRISSNSTDRVEAATLANTFAREVVGFLRDQQTNNVSADAAELSEQLEQMERETNALERRIADAPVGQAAILVAERDALVRNYGLVYEQYRQVALQAGVDPGLQIIQEAIPVVIPPTGFQIPQSRLSRMVIAGILGLLAGVVIVLLLDRFDTRVRNRKDAEERFKKPVITEIPFLPRRRRKALSLAPVTHPRSPTADAFRLLSTMLTVRTPLPTNGNGNGQTSPYGGHPTHAEPPRVILVTSPGPSDGKTTIAANLAASLTERGKRVLILSCDFRRPRIHRIFGVDNDHGLAQALEAGAPADATQPFLAPLVRRTPIEDVFVVPSGPPPERPGELLSSAAMRRAITEAKRLADVVIIDSAPILTTSDSTALIQEADAVLAVARAGRTTQIVAERTAEILERLGTPVAGVALNAASEIASPRRYYYYQYTTRADRGGRRGIPRLLRPSRKA